MTKEEFLNWPYWDLFDKIGIAAALIAMTFSILVWLNQKRRERRDNTLIYIRLRCNEPLVTITLQGQIRRKDLTRAEVQGMLGTLPYTGLRYKLDSFNKKSFFDQLEIAQVSNSVDEVVIPCSADELLQFDQTKLLEVCEVEGELSTQEMA